MTKYIFNWGARFPLFIPESAINCFPLVRSILNKTPKKELIVFSKEKDVSAYHLENNHIQKEASKKFLDREFIKKLFGEAERLQEEYWKFSRDLINSNLDTFSSEALVNYYKKLYQFLTRTFCFFELAKSEYLLLVEEKLKELTNKSNFDFLLFPTKSDEIIGEQDKWIAFAFSNPTNEQLLKYALQNVWLLNGIVKTEEILQFMTKRLIETKKISKKEYEERNKESQKVLEERSRKQEDYFSKMNSTEIKIYSELFQKKFLLRAKLKKCWGDGWYQANKLLSEVSKRTNVPFEKLSFYYKLSDVINLLEKDLVLSEEIIKSRDRCYSFKYYENGINFVEGEGAEKVIFPIVKQLENTVRIEGTVAYSGKVTGNVVIVPIADLDTLARNIEEFKKGDILVTPMTQPNMVMLMEKAAAVVTDEGGMLSHAAVISREFKTPCIVGTGLATKKLKTGDYVEVDANKGIVRKIE